MPDKTMGSNAMRIAHWLGSRAGFFRVVNKFCSTNLRSFFEYFRIACVNAREPARSNAFETAPVLSRPSSPQRSSLLGKNIYVKLDKQATTCQLALVPKLHASVFNVAKMGWFAKTGRT